MYTDYLKLNLKFKYEVENVNCKNNHHEFFSHNKLLGSVTIKYKKAKQHLKKI